MTDLTTAVNLVHDAVARKALGDPSLLGAVDHLRTVFPDHDFGAPAEEGDVFDYRHPTEGTVRAIVTKVDHAAQTISFARNGVSFPRVMLQTWARFRIERAAE